jgi:hypothetical protein
MSDVFPFLVVMALGLVGALVATGSLARRALGIAITMTTLGGPWLLPREHLLVRAFLALVVFAGIMRSVDLRVGKRGALERVGHVVSVVDTRKLVRASPRLDFSVLARVLGWLALAAIGYVLVTRVAPEARGTAYWAVRWGAGLLFVYAFSEAAYALLLASYRLAGFEPPPLHRHPAAARSVQEFWGRRWNLTVSAWLGETFFRPLARRGRPLLGVLLAFLVSAVVHAYIAGAAMGARMAALMIGYFGVQGLLVGLELALGVSRWRAVPAHVWTVGWMAALSPLFTEPLWRVLGV